MYNSCYLKDGGVISNDSERVILSDIRVLTSEESYDVTGAYVFLHHCGAVQTNVKRSFVHVWQLNAEVSLYGIWRTTVVLAFDCNCYLEKLEVYILPESRVMCFQLLIAWMKYLLFTIKMSVIEQHSP